MPTQSSHILYKYIHSHCPELFDDTPASAIQLKLDRALFRTIHSQGRKYDVEILDPEADNILYSLI